MCDWLEMAKKFEALHDSHGLLTASNCFGSWRTLFPIAASQMVQMVPFQNLANEAAERLLESTTAQAMFPHQVLSSDACTGEGGTDDGKRQDKAKIAAANIW